ncbi:MAG: 16S rRNA (guanine966-N2)-methyltransferase [Sphingobacteriales bacterium]|jgi:16S rRNA (guanine966-N2)-methyltransferase
MRIISGKHRGRNIIAPNNLPSRPTTDRAKEGLFNVLMNQFEFEDLTFLDLYSGTGNISYEMMSRGVTKGVSVDLNGKCIKFIEKTTELLQQTEWEIEHAHVLAYLKNCTKTFDIIFADPPYKFTELKKLIDPIFERKLLNEGGWLILEHQSATNIFIDRPILMKREYGDSTFTIIEN